MRASLFEPRARKVLRYKSDALPDRTGEMTEDMALIDVDAYTAKVMSHWDWSSGEDRACASSPGSESFDSVCSSPDARSSSGGELKPKGKMSVKRRMKASEREKLRMRSLAEALHQLRDYLPPVYSRRGQPLTKIQTLKYTIQYINELSSILDQQEREPTSPFPL